MNERNKQNRDAVRQMTSGQTPAEVEAQKSLTTANPDWITSDDKKSPRQQAHDSRRGVKQARESLSDKVLLKIEENEFLNYLHEQGINVEQLTEEELDELFGFNTRTSRDAVASSQSPKVRARRKKEQKDRIAKFTADRKAAKLKPEAEPQTVPHNPTEEGGSFAAAKRNPGSSFSPRGSVYVSQTPGSRSKAFNPRTGQGGSNMAEPSEHARRLKDKQDKEKEKAARTGYNPNQSKGESTEIIRNARMALAEKVLSELNRSEEYKVKQGSHTPDDIKAARIKQRRADPKAQRYMARGVSKPRGQEPDNAAAGHIRRLAGQRAATKRQNKKYADAKAAGNVTKVVTASTEIVKNGRMALAEKVLEAFQKGLKDKARAIQQASPGTRNQSAVDQAARATGDATIKKAQGKNTPRSVFGGKSNQTSTTAGGGTLGQELAKTKPESQHSMNRRGSSTVDKKKVAANLADAKSGRNAANLKKEIDADTEKRRAAKRAEG